MDTNNTIIGIDLGTTNSEVAVIKDGRAVVLEENGEAILPSVVGLDSQGQLLVEFRRDIHLGAGTHHPFTFSARWAMRSPSTWRRHIRPKRSRHQSRGTQGPAPLAPPRSVKVVITVPAFFNDGQRQATGEAGRCRP